ncbi:MULTISPECIES: TonB-dependent receptor domain-containing protein [unclassified Sphingobium]|uniref:TonB-dependent receptor domain-containing protein n=1 Tax=unclassified Sphingobium TaxID=2611147 RepID=UPI000D15A485|nr:MULTISPECIES: TonB-dependent receptor [unclassified Sphingobium]MBG6117063.1 outer membrane receptor protein involved in Fe transport [Sphingobium sp. JAI105]PSO11377.1 TonB-dependent receptor [Sphingobium sp. AEW4]TWD12729.1 outer membrane receptor protein involved in Fe transport [Sphingobium sp. AEW010]TWD30500.1 outer membrane receptor protein involved in Fe transport [Sphingobium sp. AEW013]TWD30745.1 outer membrane receptor protein involved in Fe transport [Sphingobium sp. AEW001]
MGRKAELLIVTALAIATPAHAADRQTISIAPSRLGEAVVALGRQTGVSVGMSDQSLAGIATPAVKGRLSVEAALKRLLRGSGARAMMIDASTWRIVRARPAATAQAPVRAPAAPLPDQPVAEIIVTASKRYTPLPRYAGMVEAIDANLFSSGEASGGTATLLARVASLSSTHAGNGRNKLFIRAIADSGVAGPTQATTGQYLGDMRLNYAAPDPDLKLYDVGRVEILEGPQGTLYGAGSLGGIIRIMPNAPNLGEFGGQVSAGLSATQHGAPGGDLSATINLPIMPEKIALRVVGYGVQEGGYIDDVRRDLNDVNRTRTYGGRAALRFAPDENWTVDLNGVYQHIHGRDAQYATQSLDRLQRASSVAQPYFSDYLLGNIRVERQWDSLRFVSSTGFVHHELAESYDATQQDGPSALFRQRNDIDIFSTENRLVRDLDNGLGWILGASYLQSQSKLRRSLTSYGTAMFQPQVIPGVPMIGRGLPATATGVRNKVKEATLFGEASFEPARGLIATVGGRLTNSRLSGEALDPIAALSFAEIARAEAQADRSETIFLPSFALLTDAIPGVTLYARYQQGFRPGGLAVDDQRVRRFQNDRISTAEIGFRKGVAGRDAIAISANLAYTDWRNIQADVTDRIGLPTTANIGDGRIYTAEGRIVVRAMQRLTLDASIIYNDSRLTQPAQFLRALSFEGRSLDLPNVANLGGRLAFDYRTVMGNGMRLHLSGLARYVGKSQLGVGPILGRTQGDYVDTSLSASATRGPVQISLSLANLLDSDGNRFSLGTPFDLHTDYYTPLRPRTVRIGMDFAF